MVHMDEAIAHTTAFSMCVTCPVFSNTLVSTMQTTFVSILYSSHFLCLFLLHHNLNFHGCWCWEASDIFKVILFLKFASLFYLQKRNNCLHQCRFPPLETPTSTAVSLIQEEAQEVSLNLLSILSVQLLIYFSLFYFIFINKEINLFHILAIISSFCFNMF